MSAIITNRKDQHWSAAAWVYAKILQGAATMLAEQGHHGLAKTLVAENGTIQQLQMLNLRAWPEPEYLLLKAALERAYAWHEAQGDRDWENVEFYPGFMKRFEELLNALA